MALVKYIRQVFDLSGSDASASSAPGAILKRLSCRRNDGLRLVWLPSMMIQSGRPWRSRALLKKRFAADRSRCFAEEELDCIPDAVNGAVEVHPFALDLDIGLVEMPFAGNGALAAIEALK